MIFSNCQIKRFIYLIGNILEKGYSLCKSCAVIVIIILNFVIEVISYLSFELIILVLTVSSMSVLTFSFIMQSDIE